MVYVHIYAYMLMIYLCLIIIIIRIYIIAINRYTLMSTTLMERITTRVKNQLRLQYHRYSKYKYGKMVGFISLITLFVVARQLMKVILPIILQHFSQENAYILLVVVVSNVTYASSNIVMYFIYTLKIPFFEQYRVNGDKPWPWQVNEKQWRALVKKSIKLTLISNMLILPLLLFLDTKARFRIKMQVEDIPSYSLMFVQFMGMVVVEDFLFYVTHSLLHKPFLYRFHKVHHQYTTSVSIAGLHSHFVEFLFSNSLTGAIYIKAVMIFGDVHIILLVIFVVYRLLDASNGHCGYSWPWALTQLWFFCPIQDFHDFHHSQNSGNYASQFRFWDTILGTCEDFYHFKVKQLEDEETKLKLEVNKEEKGTKND